MTKKVTFSLRRLNSFLKVLKKGSGLLSATVLGLSPVHTLHAILRVIDLRLDNQIACDGLEPKFQHAEYFTCNPLITRIISFACSFHR